MRIQTRLFIGTALLVLSLMGLQWWLYARQLRSLEQELARVATSVGRGLLTAESVFFDRDVLLAAGEAGRPRWMGTVKAPDSRASGDATDEEARDTEIRIIRLPELPENTQTIEVEVDADTDTGLSGTAHHSFEWVVEHEEGDPERERIIERRLRRVGPGGEVDNLVRRLAVRVEPGERRKDRFLVVTENDRQLTRIPIPTSPAIERVQATMREGAVVGGALLAVGLFASAVMSRRLVRPLRTLADGVETVGRGTLGVQVPVSASGEIGDLQRSFNRMSERLAQLEAEREAWRKREHLAQLGDLSRGLAHTLRNPLHTLGLAVEELADGSGDRQRLAETSRAQIGRIDRWLRSFLALGAEESASPQTVDLCEIANAVALESAQQGAVIDVDCRAHELTADLVPNAIRAALANLVENAVDASPEGERVEVQVDRDGDRAVVRIVDRGPGLPEEVRQRLYAPHVTTKVGGSGMGLFLARQLVVGMHGGELTLEDGPGGGTVATVRLPLSETGDDAGESRGG